MSDADLIRCIQAGDAAALETLYRTYLPSVWRYAYAQLCGDVAAVEDVVSETFLAAVRQVARLRPGGGRLSGWLIGIARHKVGDVRRRRVRTRTGAGDDEPIADADASADPRAASETAELRARVAAVIDRLPDEQRQVLEWKYLDGLSVRDMADRLGRTEKAVEAALYRARNAFRDAVERDLPDMRTQE